MTILLAILVGFVITFLVLGMASFSSLILGDAERATVNILTSCALAGIVAGISGYIFRDQRVIFLKAHGRLDPNSDGSELPTGEAPTTVPRMLGYLLLMTYIGAGRDRTDKDFVSHAPSDGPD